MKKRGYKEMVQGVQSTWLCQVIDDYVHNDRDKEIIKMNLLHGVSYTHIADRLEPWLSPRTIQEIMNRWMPVIMDHIDR